MTTRCVASGSWCSRAASVPISRGTTYPAADWVEEIRLEPKEAFKRTGSVEISSSRDVPAGVWRATWRQLWIGGVDVALWGTPVTGDRWLFRGVPVGEYRCMVFDGLSWSAEFDMRIDADESLEYSARFDSPTGVTVRVVDESAKRLFDASVAALPKGADPRGSRFISLGNSLTESRLDAGGDDDALRMGDLEPGSYTLYIHKYGFEILKTPATVVRGEITHIECQLRKLP